MQHPTLSASTRVGLISTEPIRLAGISGAFESHPRIRIVYGDLDGMLTDMSLGYLILDIGGSPEWLHIQARVQALRPDIKRIVLGPAGEDSHMMRCLEGGARAYLDSHAGPLALRQAVEGVMEGMIWAPRRVLSLLVDRLMRSRNHLGQELAVSRAKPSYSPRERQVLDLIMTASSNREIAEELGIEERTVKAYVASLMRKSGVDNRVSLSVQATQESMRGKQRSSFESQA